MKYGVLGGSFDPPHLAHKALAIAAIEQLQLDQLFVIPANKNPLKSGTRYTSAKQRLEMTKLTFENVDKVAISDIEIQRGGPSFTTDTLFDLQAAIPGDYFLIMGADSLKSFHEWKEYNKILVRAKLAVGVRPPDTFELLQMRLLPAICERMVPLEIPTLDISSTEIRKHFSMGKIPQQWLDPKVVQYIQKNNLYKNI